MKYLSGPESWPGSVGKLLATDVWNLPDGTYQKIASPKFRCLPDKVVRGLKSDNRLLYELVEYVITG